MHSKVRLSLLYMVGSILQVSANVPSIFTVSDACPGEGDAGRLRLLAEVERYDQDTVRSEEHTSELQSR